jgi:hypothetical protein
MRRLSTAFGALVVTLVAGSAAADILRVHPDGGGYFPNIQAAIDAAVDGDIIELSDGTFTGDGNRDLNYLGKAITIRSQGGNPENCIIDCEGSETDPHRGFSFVTSEGNDSILKGIAMKNGYTHYDIGGTGGAVHNCTFVRNRAQEGASVAFTSHSNYQPYMVGFGGGEHETCDARCWWFTDDCSKRTTRSGPE